MSQTTDWATPAMMKRLIPLPRPQPFWMSSSISMTMSPAARSWKKIISAVEPVSEPNMPLMMYAAAWMPVRRMLNTLLAEVNKPLSSEFDMSHWMIEDPASNWRIKPAVTMGPMPSCIRVPLLDAKITRSWLNEA